MITFNLKNRETSMGKSGWKPIIVCFLKTQSMSNHALKMKFLVPKILLVLFLLTGTAHGQIPPKSEFLEQYTFEDIQQFSYEHVSVKKVSPAGNCSPIQDDVVVVDKPVIGIHYVNFRVGEKMRNNTPPPALFKLTVEGGGVSIPTQVKYFYRANRTNYNLTVCFNPFEMEKFVVGADAVVLTSSIGRKEANREVSGRVKSGNGYEVSTSNYRAAVKIDDEDGAESGVPTVSIRNVSGKGTVTEGDAAEFEISADPMPEEDELEVYVDVWEAGDFMSGGGRTKVRPYVGIRMRKTVKIASWLESTFSENTKVDDIKEGSGRITYVLVTSKDYLVDSANSKATVVILDDDSPDISISAVTNENGNSVLNANDDDDGTGVEGTEFTFEITAQPAPANDLVVNMSVCKENVEFKTNPTGVPDGVTIATSDSSCNYDNSLPVTIKAGKTSAKLLVATTNRTTDDDNGRFVVMVESAGRDANYTVDLQRSRVDIEVTDDETDVTITLTSPTTPSVNVTEGNSFSVTLTSSGPTTKTVKVDMEQSGSFLSSEDRDEIELDFNNSTSNTKTIAIPDDSIDEDNGTVTATIQAGNYVLGSRKSGTVNILDNDAVTVYIKNGAHVSSGTNRVAEIPIYVGSTQTNSLTINVSVEGGWDYNSPSSALVPTATKPSSITIPAGQKEVTLRVPLASTIDENHPSGYVTATLQSRTGSGYQLASYTWQRTGTAYVNGPTVQIDSVSIGDKIKPGGLAEFELTASKEPIERLQVRVKITQTGFPFDVFNEERNYYQSWNIESGEKTLSKTIHAGNVWAEWISTGEQVRLPNKSGSLKAELNSSGPGNKYAVGRSSSDTVAISFDAVEPSLPDLPVISATRLLDNEVEGVHTLSGDSTMSWGLFRICADRRLTADLNVDINISQSGNFLKDTNDSYQYTNWLGESAQASIKGVGDHTIRMPRNSECEGIFVGIDNDTTPEPDGIITLTISEPDADDYYTVAASPNNTSNVYVEDDDGTRNPHIAIEAFNHPDGYINEGRNALFWIHFPRSLDGQTVAYSNSTFSITVKASVSDVGDFLAAGEEQTDKLIPIQGNSANFFYRTFDGRKTSAWLLAIPTHDDMTFEDNGSVTVRLKTNSSNGNTYNFSSNAESARVEVRSEDLMMMVGGVDSQYLNETDPDRGPLPEVSILAISESIVEGEDALFIIESNPAPSQSMIVHLSLVSIGGDFIDGYNTTGIGFPAGEQSSMVAVKTLDDNVEESDGSVTATIVESTSYTINPASKSASVTVLDNDDNVFDRLIAEANRKILPEVVRAMGARVQEGVESRVEVAFNSKSTSLFEYDGRTSLEDLVTMSGDAVNDEGTSWYSVLGKSSFNIPMFPETSGASPVALWGLGDFRDSSKGPDEEAFSWNGNMFSGQFGFDARLSPESLAGLSFTITENSADFTSDKEELLEGTHQVNMTSTSPYLGWKSPDGMSELNVFVSYGIGEVRVDMEGYEPEIANSSMQMASFGGKRELHSSMHLLGNGSSKLNLEGGLLYARHLLYDNASRIKDTETQIHQFRLAFVSDHEHALADGSLLNPSLSVGARQEGGDGDAWSGLEFGTLINYENRFGLSVSSENGVLFAGGQSVREWVVQGSLAYDRLRDDLGMQMDVSPSVGQVRGDGLDSLWDSDFSSFETNDDGFTTGVDAELGYGFGILDGKGIFTPFSGISLTNGSGKVYSLGSRIAAGPNTSFEFVGSRGVNNTAQNRLEINGSINW